MSITSFLLLEPDVSYGIARSYLLVRIATWRNDLRAAFLLQLEEVSQLESFLLQDGVREEECIISSYVSHARLSVSVR